jgi:hypothetical protein
MTSIRLVSALGILFFISFASVSDCASKRMKDNGNSFAKRVPSCETHPCNNDGDCRVTEICDLQGCCQPNGLNQNGTCIACQRDDQCLDMPNLCVKDCCLGPSTTTTIMPLE